jgi:hypothetical protein
MNNPFKRIIHHQSVPDVLKKKVLSDIGMIKLTLDIADLFLVKYPNTIGDLLNNDNKSNHKD